MTYHYHMFFQYSYFVGAVKKVLKWTSLNLYFFHSHILFVALAVSRVFSTFYLQYWSVQSVLADCTVLDIRLSHHIESSLHEYCSRYFSPSALCGFYWLHFSIQRQCLQSPLKFSSVQFNRHKIRNSTHKDQVTSYSIVFLLWQITTNSDFMVLYVNGKW